MLRITSASIRLDRPWFDRSADWRRFSETFAVPNQANRQESAPTGGAPFVDERIGAPDVGVIVARASGRSVDTIQRVYLGGIPIGPARPSSKMCTSASGMGRVESH
jgi:hypothetical protein